MTLDELTREVSHCLYIPDCSLSDVFAYIAHEHGKAFMLDNKRDIMVAWGKVSHQEEYINEELRYIDAIPLQDDPR